MEIIVAVSMFNTTIYCFSSSGEMAACEMGEEESIDIRNISNHFASNHFETVRKT